MAILETAIKKIIILKGEIKMKKITDVCQICNRKHCDSNFVDTMQNLTCVNSYWFNTVTRLKLNKNLVLCSDCLHALMAHWLRD